MTRPAAVGEVPAALDIGTLLGDARTRLARAGVASPALDARLLVVAALGVEMAHVVGYPERPVAVDEARRVEALVRRRVAREPMARIIGAREFWSLPFRVGPETLIPRPDSETLVEAALAWAGGRGDVATILDLGTGSGCLLLSLLTELPAATGVGVDLCPRAVVIARANARALGLGARACFSAGDWGRALAGTFDIIVCNPPYVAAGEIDGLEIEVTRFEPRLALDGGADGLDAFRAVMPDVARLLAPRGAAFFEMAPGQARKLGKIACRAGLPTLGVTKDLAGIDRCFAARRPIPHKI